MKPMLSIIIPVLNEAARIEHSLAELQPLRAQCFAELIVVDGGSTDCTAHRAAPLADQLLHTARGRALQMNAGAAASAGDVLLFLHADTALPDNASTLIRDGLAISECAWGRFDVRIEGRPRMLRVVALMMNLRSRLTGIATGDQVIFVQREDFFAVGGFPSQPLMEDIEISRRLKRRSAPLCLREQVTTSGRRWEEHGVWRTIVLMWCLRLMYWLGFAPEKLVRAYR